MNRNFIKYWLPVILWMGVIFWMSTGSFSAQDTASYIEPVLYFLFPGISPDEVEVLHGLIRKAGHVTEYFILGLFLFRAFRGDSSQVWRLPWTLYAVIWVILYAASDEFHQSFVAARTTSLFDVGIDTVGGILAQGAIGLWYRWRSK